MSRAVLKKQHPWMEWIAFLRDNMIFEKLVFNKTEGVMYSSPSRTLEFDEVGIAAMSDY